MTDQNRMRLSLRLDGGEYPDGEIPLVALARIADETQQLVRRLARSLTDRGGPGRTPTSIEEATSLWLVGIHQGSTTLDIAGPRVQQLPLELFEDIGSEAIGTMLDGLEALATENQLPAAFDERSVQSLDGWLESVGTAAAEVELSAELGSRQRRVVRVEPNAARAVLSHRSSPERERPAPSPQSVEGRLYAVNLETGRYAIRDDAGYSISLTGEGYPSDLVEGLVGQRVRAQGTAHFDDSRRLQLDLEDLRPVPPLEGVDSEKFFRNVELDELLRGKTPLEPQGDLVIEGLTDDEIEAFLAAGDD
ncbi:MAG: hypothetical protein ACRDYA_04355 [Egibacteraceae bacterium]